MRRMMIAVSLSAVAGACSRQTAAPQPNSSHIADSVLAAHKEAAPALAIEARGTMAELLTDRASATFDSLVVVQPAMTSGTWPGPVVCGRLGGKPGVKGATGMTPFIYRNRVTVFVLDGSNVKRFADLKAKYCGGQILLQ